MKKVVLLLSVFTLMFTSCGNDDDAAAVDPIVGVWKYYKYFENDVEDVFLPCENENTFVFNAEGAFSYIDYLENASNDCEVDESVSGTWFNVGNSNYTLTDGVDSITENTTFEGNTFSFIGIYNDGTEDITYREVYIRQ